MTPTTGANSTATIHDTKQRDGDDDEQAERVLARRTGVEADRQKAGDGDERARQHRERGRGVGEGRRAVSIVAGLEPRHHHLDGDHRIVDQKAERDDQRAERDALQRNAPNIENDEGDGEHQRNRHRDDEPGAHAEAEKAHQQHDDDGLAERLGEAADGLFDDPRLIGDKMHADADRQRRLDLAHLGFQRRAEVEQVAALAHGDGEADGGLAVIAEQHFGRIDIAATNVGDIGQPEEAVVDAQIDRLEAFFRHELAADAQQHLLSAGLNDAGRNDGILRLQGPEQRLQIDAEAGELAGGDDEIDRLVLGADQLGLADVLDLQHGVADAFGIVAQLPHGEAVGREGVDVAEDVAELVVETDALEGIGKAAANVVDVLADLIEQVRQLLRIGGVLELDEDDGAAGDGIAAGEIEQLHLLDFLLDAVGDLIERFAERGARPLGGDHHDLDGEGGILLASETGVGHHASHDRDDHQKHDEGAMRERPFRQIEARHSLAASALLAVPASPATACPSCRL